VLLKKKHRHGRIICHPAIKNDDGVILPLLEIALVLVRFDHIVSFIVNADHSIM
jgi:hypothetical protein